MGINVVVADDHEVVRSGLASLLKGTEISIVDEASNGDEAVEKTMAHNPDVVLMDIRMPQTDGLAALEQIKKASPNTRVVMLSTYDNPTYIARGVALGAHDYVLKGSSRETIVSAIENAAADNPIAEDSLMNRVRGAMAKRQEAKHSDIPLTNREMQVLRHLALGLSNREIGRSLNISIETVKEHVQNILRKIDVTDRTQAAVWAVRRGLV
ncbi:response regulator [Blastopirellula marina]|uniref:DNA-binding response regulator n=1 Tax=Blastopirellula marina TaxID=124 RepID=A0A2S8GU83_9BACT|nr:response regulator transcription factor [Blastopirellula marina]PQO35196.1 DNA-binding response regulator [Blastopirellula marina]PQO47987.1 DNA-binding response regulator [Blastopirellula marina]PTL43945.1 DNA-binding response regulator [Blastopirellula marina]